MLILGTVSIAKSMGKGHQVQVQTVAPGPRRVGPLDKNCRICRKDVKWWQASVKQDNGFYTKNVIGMRGDKELISSHF
jgi:hypothetical protein